MDYNKIIDSTYSWFSFSKAIWFLLFFWLALPVLFLVPIAFEQGLFYYGFSWALQGLYVITYISILLGLFLLTGFVLNNNNIKSKEISISVFLDIIFLVFCEFFYTFFWNINKKFRFTQILLLFGSGLLGYYSLFVQSQFIFISFIIFVVCYTFFVLYNFLRVSFSLTLFLHNDFSIIESIFESWHLTHNKALQIFFGYLFNLVTVFVIFVVVSIILGAIANLLLVNYLTIALSYKLAMVLAVIFAFAPALVSYYFGFMEMYLQLINQHLSNKKIKNMLADKVVQTNKIVVTKKVKKSKPIKKSVKKIIKKKSSNKKSIKK
ncbi:MAG: hypothetical protein PHX27_00280 [Candidatus ainarchaeum sp.]|nr:hypothetical protein [Candidatus ainarchaeum sp.]